MRQFRRFAHLPEYASARRTGKLNRSCRRSDNWRWQSLLQPELVRPGRQSRRTHSHRHIDQTVFFLELPIRCFQWRTRSMAHQVNYAAESCMNRVLRRESGPMRQFMAQPEDARRQLPSAAQRFGRYSHSGEQLPSSPPPPTSPPDMRHAGFHTSSSRHAPIHR